ncbi:MAG: YdeI/OmpD-associated family protein [Flavobacteriaceae bacterium]
MESEVFEVSLKGSHSVVVPEPYALPFLKTRQQRVSVRAEFEGRTIDFHAALQKYKGQIMITFGKRYQKELGVFPNDYFKLQLSEDKSKYGVEMPEELEAVLQSDKEAADIFHSFTAGRIRGMIYTITRYKNSQTRIDKSLILAENLRRGIRDPRQLFKAG